MSVSIAVSDLRKTYSTGVSSRSKRLLLAARRSHEMVSANALDGISFSVAEGERVGIVGENGAGKSTLLRILAGLAQPTSGAVDVKGRVHAALTLGIGLREEMTGRENLYIDAEIQGVAASRLATHVDAMVTFADLGEFIDRPVRTYSSGMKSRLSFTSLVFIEPEILLIDEALSAGDQWFQRKANAAVRELCARGKIIIVVSHGLPAIVEMCSRCLWLHHGKIAADGDPVDVTALYSDHERRREEQRLAGEFSGRVDNWSKTRDTSIAGLTLGEHPGAPAKYLFRPDAGPTVTIDLALSKPLHRPSLRLWIERIDGLTVSENQPPALLMERGMAPGLYRVNANMERLLLGPGLFLLFVELRDGETPIARRSLAFKVDIDRPLIGGRPVLHAPISVSAVRASA